MKTEAEMAQWRAERPERLRLFGHVDQLKQIIKSMELGKLPTVQDVQSIWSALNLGQKANEPAAIQSLPSWKLKGLLELSQCGREAVVKLARRLNRENAAELLAEAHNPQSAAWSILIIEVRDERQKKMRDKVSTWNPVDAGIDPIADSFERLIKTPLKSLPDRLKAPSTLPSRELAIAWNEPDTDPDHGPSPDSRCDLLILWLQLNGFHDAAEKIGYRLRMTRTRLLAWEREASQEEPSERPCQDFSDRLIEEYESIIGDAREAVGALRQLAGMLRGSNRTAQVNTKPEQPRNAARDVWSVPMRMTDIGQVLQCEGKKRTVGPTLKSLNSELRELHHKKHQVRLDTMNNDFYRNRFKADR